MYIMSVHTISNTLPEPPAGLQPWQSVLVLNETDAKNNGVWVLNTENEFVRHPDQVMFAPHFDTIRVTVIADNSHYILTQEVGSQVGEFEQEWVYETVSEPEPEETPEPEELQ
jgi:hypothetical protein